MQIAEKTVLITGANRGVGEALVKEALNRGAKRVFAGTRGALPNTDPRVTALTLDVTNASHIQRAVDQVADLDLLINNAGIGISDDLTDQRGNCEHSVSDLGCSFPSNTRLLDLEGGGAQPDTIPASTADASRSQRAWCDPRIR